jgi:acetyl-CoA acyltransferase
MGNKTSLNYHFSIYNPDYYYSMGLTAEEVSNQYGISRENQDQFAYHSHQRALAAIDSGVFKAEIHPFSVETISFSEGKRKSEVHRVLTDEGPRRDTDLEVLGKLKPVFSQKGTVTAGNSSQTTDGAAFVMVVSEAFLKRHNLTPMARFVGYSVAGVEPKIMGMGPVKAVPKVLKRTGIALKEVDLIELNEAFASQSLAVIRDLELPFEKTNVHGGAIALGHPLGCTGARLTLHLMHQLKENKKIK